MKIIKKLTINSGILLIATTLLQCTTSGGHGSSYESELKISDSPGPETPLIAPTAIKSGTAKAGSGKAAQTIAWFSCLLEKPAPAVVLAHDEDVGFDAKNFCNTPESQAFMRANLNVIGFNRPGFAPSTGKKDLVGQSSQQAALLALKAATSKSDGKITAIDGAYGFGTGAAAVSFLAKQSGGMKWLIAGGGVYDFEVTANESSSAELKKAISAAVQTEGDEAYETRSIAYDVNGLPNRIALFRGREDTVAPASQADSFRAGLAASEYKVTFQEIAGLGARIDPTQLQQILDVMITSVR